LPLEVTLSLRFERKKLDRNSVSSSNSPKSTFNFIFRLKNKSLNLRYHKSYPRLKDAWRRSSKSTGDICIVYVDGARKDETESLETIFLRKEKCFKKRGEDI
jgi:hypothetical protein